jgi:hypothetical protein
VRDPKLVAETIKGMLGQGNSVDDVISELKTLGLSKMDSMIALEDYGGLPHAEAKLAVHQSSAWSDVRAAAEQLESETLSELEKRGRRRADGTIEL